MVEMVAEGSTNRKLNHFTDLAVWQAAHALVLEVYSLINNFPQREKYALEQQLIRAAVSVPENITEGFRRRIKPEKVRFYNIAQGSLAEVTCFLILAKDLKDTAHDHRDTIDRLDKKLTSLIGAVQR